LKIEAGQESFSLFGREEILGRLHQRLEALKKGYRQNIGLIGPRFIGKTHLLAQFLEKARKNPEILPIYIPLAPTDFDGFVERWVGGLLQSFLMAQGMALPEEFQSLVKTCRLYIPKTLEHMREAKKRAFQKKTGLAFRELLNLTAVLREETGKKILLVIDEFQSLESLELADPFSLFGKEMMIQKDTLYLVTSSAPHKAREIFHDQLSLLFGNFEVIEVGCLKMESLRSWVHEKYQGLSISNSDFRILSHLLNNHPYYFHLFFEHAHVRSLTKVSFAWSREFLLETIRETLYEDQGFLNHYFESELQNLLSLGRSYRAHVKILLAVANGRPKLNQIAAYAGKKIQETKKMLQRLAGEGAIEKRGSFFRLPDPLFRFWLRNVYQIKDRELAPTKERTRATFESRLVEEIRKIEEEDRLDLTARLEGLFREFRNDVVEVSQKKIKCPTFLEIASRPTNGRFFPIFSRTSQGRWFCQVFRDSVTEGDVAGFSEELKKSRRKVQRKIMVTLGGIELNAKLMAQEAKIQIWDLENLNALFDLYGKLKLIPA